MKKNNLPVIFLLIMFGNHVMAQEGHGKAKTTTEQDAGLLANSLSIAFGGANYFGDLMKSSSLYHQGGISFDIGFNKQFNPHFSWRADLGIIRIKGADSEPGGAYPSRNLSFSSTVLDFSAAMQANFTDYSLHKFGPIIYVGAGVTTFDPTTEDNLGNKQKLRDLNTEAQGKPGYPKKYSKTAFILPIGFGFRYDIPHFGTLSFECCYHFTSTDYLDDVSFDGYPDPALLSAKTKEFTWRGAGAYPTNLKLHRGNPGDKDGYYTTHIKYSFNLGSH